MLFLPISAILALGLTVQVWGFADYDDIMDEDNYDDYGDSYHDGDETLSTSSYEESIANRVRRYELMSAFKTLGPQDVREVRGALKQLLSGIAVENPFTPFTTASYSDSTPYSSTSLATYDTTLNATHSGIITYLSKLMTETIQFSTSKPTRSNHQLRLFYPTVNVTEPNTVGYQKIHPSRVYGQYGLDGPNTIIKEPDLDIPKLLAIISDLASEFETNLTRKLNETLITMTLPECTTPSTPAPITSKYDAHYTGSIISKVVTSDQINQKYICDDYWQCFVCGLTIPRIPQHAHCADAFAGDFLPLVPVDPTAKGKISRFRKYCKYERVSGFQYNNSEPRIIRGRWTGGCSVRWIDLSGVYTQRTCRDRLQPTMGRHFASKRMAKLERTLWNVENGCITSPMATLVPLSRGISLYARFHACVCTGSWCNVSGLTRPCFTFIVTVSSLLTVITNILK